MAQHDYDLADAAGLAFRADLNNVLAAIISQNSATTEPTTTVAYMFWADTTTAILKQRNAGNSAWISLFNMTTGQWLGAISGNAATVTVADAAADTTTWPMLATSQTGNQAPATDAGLTYDASTNVLGASISGSAGSVAGIPLAAGTYTPTAANIVGTSARTPTLAQYMRVGNVVTVSGVCDVTYTAAGFAFSMTLPVASDLTIIANCSGLLGCENVNMITGVITGNTTSNLANMFVQMGNASGGPLPFYYTYTYLIQ